MRGPLVFYDNPRFIKSRKSAGVYNRKFMLKSDVVLTRILSHDFGMLRIKVVGFQTFFVEPVVVLEQVIKCHICNLQPPQRTDEVIRTADIGGYRVGMK